jgi:ATP-dependent Clp protease ATP-binding subunit ClpC
MRLASVHEDIVQLLNEKTAPARPKETPLLAEFSRDLTEAAIKQQLDPLVGRETELERVQQVLCRRTKNNAVLIGEPGVGKTAIVEGLAQKIVCGDVRTTWRTSAFLPGHPADRRGHELTAASSKSASRS